MREHSIEQKLSFREQLSLPGMLKKAGVIFHKITDPLKTNRHKISLRDCMMSGLAIFLLKYPSLLSLCASDSETKIR